MKLLIILMFISLVYSQKVVFVCEEYPPYEFIDNDNKPNGLDIEIIRNIMIYHPTIEYEIKFKNWDDGYSKVISGEYDAIFCLYKNKNREKYLYYPITPLSIDRNVFFVNNNFNINIKSLEDVKDLKIGVVKENSYGNKFDSFNFKNKIQCDNQLDLLKKFTTNKFDIYVNSTYVGWYYIIKYNLKNIKRVDYIINSDPLYIAFSKKSKNGKMLNDIFEEGLRRMKRNNELEQIRKKYIK